MATLRRLALAALLCGLAAAPARAFQADGGPDYRGSITFGAGTAHGLLGMNAELGRGHWAGYFGLGLANLLPAAAVSGGARWFAFEGHGPVVSLGVSYVVIESQDWLRGAYADWATGPATSARLGWRLRLGALTAELGAGPALVRRAASAASPVKWAASFDIDIGIGFEL